MKFLIQVIVTIVISFALQYFFPWWTMVLGAAAAGYFFGQSGLQSFIAGLLGVAILWFGMAFVIDASTQSILTQKVGKLLPVHPLVMTALVGGLVGGFGALTGTMLRNPKRRRH